MKARLKAEDWIALAALGGLLAYFLARHPARPSWVEVVVTLAFALGGWLLRGVDLSGAIAGGVVAFVLYSAAGWRMFLVLFGLFVLTLLATLFERSRKSALGVAEPGAGRSAAQVGANLFVAATSLVLLPGSTGAAVALAALCEAGADTVSSEIGEAVGGKTLLILTLRPTAPGANGGISLAGTLAGIAGSAAVAALGLLVTGFPLAAIAFGGGVVGMMVDSVLGASLESNGYLNNEAVNLLGTASAAGVAYLMCS